MRGNLFEQFNEFIQLNARRDCPQQIIVSIWCYMIFLASLLLVAHKLNADRWQLVIVGKLRECFFFTDSSSYITSISYYTLPNHVILIQINELRRMWRCAVYFACVLHLPQMTQNACALWLSHQQTIFWLFEIVAIIFVALAFFSCSRLKTNHIDTKRNLSTIH